MKHLPSKRLRGVRQFLVARLKRIPISAVAAAIDHGERRSITKNVVLSRTDLNKIYRPHYNEDFDFGVLRDTKSLDYARDRMSKARGSSDDMLEFVLTYSDDAPIEPDAFFQQCIDAIIEMFGKDNLVCAALHMDEKTPHVHAYITPVYTKQYSKETLRRSGYKDKVDGTMWRNFRHFFPAVRKEKVGEDGEVELNKKGKPKMEIVRNEYHVFQDWAHREIGAPLGLRRGRPKKKRGVDHITTRDFQSAIGDLVMYSEPELRGKNPEQLRDAYLNLRYHHEVTRRELAQVAADASKFRRDYHDLLELAEGRQIEDKRLRITQTLETLGFSGKEHGGEMLYQINGYDISVHPAKNVWRATKDGKNFGSKSAIDLLAQVVMEGSKSPAFKAWSYLAQVMGDEQADADLSAAAVGKFRGNPEQKLNEAAEEFTNALKITLKFAKKDNIRRDEHEYNPG